MVRYFRHLLYTCLSYKCIITRLIVAFSVCMFSFNSPNSPKTTRQVGCKSLLWAINLVITPACLHTSGRVYWVLSMGRIHQTPHLSHVVLLSVISSSHCLVRLSTLTIYQYIQFQHVINWSLHPVSSKISTSRSDYYVCFCVQLCVISVVLYPTCSVPFKY